jgi:DNA-binding MarR family transcriptional regulator
MHHINRHSDHWSGQEKILTTLLDSGAMTQHDLAKLVDITAPSLSEALVKLEKRKFIKRETNSQDKRSNLVSLTKRSQKIVERYKRHQKEMEKQMFDSLTESEKSQMLAILEKMHSDIDKSHHSHFHFRGKHFSFDNHKKPSKSDK